MVAEQRTLVQRTVPKPVRKLFRWMNFHFKEDGRLIYGVAKRLPEEQKNQVLEHGKDLTTVRSKMNVPRGVRNVAASLVVGQGMWYFVCPYLAKLPAIREGNPGAAWLVGGGLDKLFLHADELLYKTGGQSQVFSEQLVDMAPKTVAFGLAVFALEIATDFSRCFIEYWSQKKYGVMADGAARTYGQVRPFPMRYSSLEAYQKIISIATRPWVLGTPGQLFSSFYGILGSLWRTGPQLAVVITVGRVVDKFFKKISEWTGLHKVAKRIVDNAKQREEKLLSDIRDVLGEEKYTALRIQLAAESRRFWTWNIFGPALSLEKAEIAAKTTIEYYKLERQLAECTNEEDLGRSGIDFVRAIGNSRADLERSIGAKALRKIKAYKQLSAMNIHGYDDVRAASGHLMTTLQEIQTEHCLN